MGKPIPVENEEDYMYRISIPEQKTYGEILGIYVTYWMEYFRRCDIYDWLDCCEWNSTGERRFVHLGKSNNYAMKAYKKLIERFPNKGLLQQAKEIALQRWEQMSHKCPAAVTAKEA